MSRQSLRIAGMVFGAWISWLYAFLSDEINRLFLPGIPLPPASGGYWSYYGGALLAGALIGLACTWPDSPWLGALWGGLSGALLSLLAPWQQVDGSSPQIFGVVVLTATTFIPLVVLLMPLSLLVRRSVEQLPLPGEALHPSKVWLPLLVTALVAAVGISRLFPQEVRDAFYSTQALIESAQQVKRSDQLPAPLQDVKGFIPNANGRYTLEWSDRVEQFFGPHPVSNRLNSDFLIIARYQNGFSLACIFAPGARQPPCAVFR